MAVFRLICILSALFAPSSSAQAQRDFSDVEITTTQVNATIYMLHANWGTGNIAASIGEDGILIVDDQFAPLAEKIDAALTAVQPGPLKFILNTHWHGDHTGGNIEFGPKAPIIAHTNVRKRLMTAQRVFQNTIPAAPKAAWPVVTFDTSISIHFNGEEIKVLHFPHGHTDGDSIVFFTTANVIHMGDHFFVGRFPFIDLENGGTVQGYTQNVKSVIDQAATDVNIIPGHGPLSTLDELKVSHQMLVETTYAVQQAISAGKSLDVIKAAGVPKEWQSWGGGSISTDLWLTLVYQSLTTSQ